MRQTLRFIRSITDPMVMIGQKGKQKNQKNFSMVHFELLTDSIVDNWHVFFLPCTEIPIISV